MTHVLPTAILTLLMVWAAPGCKTAYYAAWEKLGYEKRDLLVDQVQDARKQQEETKQEFASALDQFKATINFDGGDLEKTYRKLQGSYEDAEKEADQLGKEIDKVEELAKDLFREWKDEIGQQNNADYKRLMKDQRDATLKAYEQMIDRMRDAEAKVDPVLRALDDRVLLLKSSLNAKAIASLEANADELIGDIESLIAEMNKSIAEADRFIASMGD
jgi:chromosome segregation ATPase